MSSFKDGAGVVVPCRQQIDQELRNMSEFDKIASAGAATIIALIPIIFSNSDLPTADVLELYMIGEYVLAFFSAGLTYGLPVSQQRSHRPIKAKDLSSSEDISNALSPLPSFYWRYAYLYNVCFVFMQVILLLGYVTFNAQPILGNIHPILVCPGTAMLVMYIAVFSTPVLVGSVWLLALIFTFRGKPGGLERTYHRNDLYPSRNVEGKYFRQLVVKLGSWFVRELTFRREHRIVLYPSRQENGNGRRLVFARLLLGTGRVVMLILLTTTFGSVYGATFPTAIGRMSITAGFLFFSRTISIVHSQYISAGTTFVTYDTDDERKEVMEKWRELHQSDSSQVPLQGLGSRVPTQPPRVSLSLPRRTG